MTTRKKGAPQVYARVKEGQPQDPMEKRGLSSEDLDTLLEKHSHRDDVQAKIAEIMTAGNVRSGRFVVVFFVVSVLF